VSMDMTRLLNAVLLQQTQAQDGNGAETITSIYTKWYLEVVLRRVSSGQILFSPHLREMIASGDQALNFAPDQFTDTVELRALVQLIGPYGVKFMTERLVWHVASQMNELCKIVAEHRELLRTVRTSFDKPEKMRQLLAQLGDGIPKDKRQQLDAMDNVLQRVTIIGEICEFRYLLHAALNDVIEQRSPFLVGAVNGMLGSMSEEDQTLIGEMCASVGVRTKVDIALVNAIRAQTHGSSPDELYHLSCLLMVFIAVSLPRLAQAHATFFKASLAASLNNAHCIPTAVNVMAGALFNLHQRGDTIERMKEFLALASSSLLRMSDNMDRDSMKNPEPVYLLLDKLVSQSPWLSFDLLESCFPYNLLRTSYHFCYKEEQARMDGQ